MNSDLLVRPVMLWLPLDAVFILHLTKRCFDVVLAPVGQDDLVGAPVVVVGKQECLAEQGSLELLPGTLAKAVDEVG